MKGYAIYLTVNEADGEGVKAEDITRINAIWADWDEGRPEKVPFEPSFVVRTSREKLQAFWLVKGHMTPAQFKSYSSKASDCFRAR